MPLLEAALNGDRDHPRVPRTPEDLAHDAKLCAAAGADALHLHPYDLAGRETLAAEASAAAIRAVHAACPGIPISLSTSADIEADPTRRLKLIAAWSELPELVTANQGEDGIVELCEHLIDREVGIEAGLLTVADAEAFVESGLAPRCVRALVEPLGTEPEAALAEAEAIEAVLAEAKVGLEQVHHGDGMASWAINERGAARGHGIRTGLEDTTVLPDGSEARGNADLVRAAAAIFG
jgi:uncharacterized protein (DUF849 family)